MTDKLLTLGEASQVMRCSYSKAAKMARAGRFPFRKLGSNWVIAESALYRELGMSRASEVDGHAKQSA